MSKLWAQLARGWAELHRLPPLAWLSPRQEVAVVHADGRTSLWRGDLGRAVPGGRPSDAVFVAVEVPADDTLERRCVLPPISERDREAALELDLSAHSPFAPEDLVWGFRSSGEHAVVMLTSRRAVARAVATGEAARSAGLGAGGRWNPEVWAFDSDGLPVMLRGFGEQARMKGAGRRLGLAWALILLAMVLAAVGFVTPTVQLKLRTMQAAAALAALDREFAPVVTDREALTKVLGLQTALLEQIESRIEPLGVLDFATELIPDDTWLQRLQLRGSRLTISGQTTNATALMRRLSDHPLVREVRSPGSATRVSGGRENFVIEMTLLAPALRAVPAPAGPASAAVRAVPLPQALPDASAASAAPAVAGVRR